MRPGWTIQKDPSAKKVYTFKFSNWLVSPAQIASHTVTIVSPPDASLTLDNDAIVNVVGTNDGVRVRIVGGTLGEKYTVTCHIVTNETPAQEEDASLFVEIKNQ